MLKWCEGKSKELGNDFFCIWNLDKGNCENMKICLVSVIRIDIKEIRWVKYSV